MTKLLERAIESARKLPAPQQDAIAEEVLALVELHGGEEEEELDPHDLEAVLAGLADIEARRIATDEKVEALFARFTK